MEPGLRMSQTGLVSVKLTALLVEACRRLAEDLGRALLTDATLCDAMLRVSPLHSIYAKIVRPFLVVDGDDWHSLAVGIDILLVLRRFACSRLSTTTILPWSSSRS
ncbi:hypothetical protein BC835DRAFT_883876 [Cytidiella melzeri]|nr:hypothetical protein BC835DRAFT_883876 [Cytidiella melzeri]